MGNFSRYPLRFQIAIFFSSPFAIAKRDITLR